MEAYQLRVVEEKYELDQKIPKLRNFIESDFFNPLDHDEKERMYRQYQVMQDYSGILKARIANFNPGGENVE